MTPTISIIDTKSLYEYIQKQYDNRRFTRFIEIGSTFFLISFFLFFAVRPTALIISALVGEIKAKEIISQQMKTKIDKVILAQDTFSQIQQNYGLIDAALPSRPNYSSVAEYFNGSAQQSQLETNTISFNLNTKETDKSTNDSVGTYKASTSIRGNFLSSMDYINKLLHSRRVIDIKSVSISNKETDKSKEETQSSGALNIGVDPIIYFWQGQYK